MSIHDGFPALSSGRRASLTDLIADTKRRRKLAERLVYLAGETAAVARPTESSLRAAATNVRQYDTLIEQAELQFPECRIDRENELESFRWGPGMAATNADLKRSRKLIEDNLAICLGVNRKRLDQCLSGHVGAGRLFPQIQAND